MNQVELFLYYLFHVFGNNTWLSVGYNWLRIWNKLPIGESKGLFFRKVPYVIKKKKKKKKKIEDLE